MKAVIAAYARSPFQFARKGRFTEMRPDEIAAQTVRALLARISLDSRELEDLILGCAYPEASQGDNLARIAGQLAGLPHSVGGMTVNRFCGSSMQAIQIAAGLIEAGMGDVFLCGGVESMTMVPQGGLSFSPNPYLLAHTNTYLPMGQTAENVAERWSVSREVQDAFALESHRKAAAARSAGHFEDEIVPIRLGGGELVREDGCIRAGTSLEALAALDPAFRRSGTVTAGTSSPLTDGAAMVLVTTEEVAAGLGVTPLARIRGFATVGVDPAVMGIGPVPASQKALRRAGLDSDQLDVIELNEAFAAQAIACIRDLRLDPGKVNIDGGALALGHPLGATGARITGKAAALLSRTGGRYALATQCIGGGQGIATVLERL